MQVEQGGRNLRGYSGKSGQGDSILFPPVAPAFLKNQWEFRGPSASGVNSKSQAALAGNEI